MSRAVVLSLAAAASAAAQTGASARRTASLAPGPAGYDVEFTLDPRSEKPSAVLTADSGLTLDLRGEEAELVCEGRKLAAGTLPKGKLRLTFRRRASWAALSGRRGLVVQAECAPVARG